MTAHALSEILKPPPRETPLIWLGRPSACASTACPCSSSSTPWVVSQCIDMGGANSLLLLDFLIYLIPLGQTAKVRIGWIGWIILIVWIGKAESTREDVSGRLTLHFNFLILGQFNTFCLHGRIFFSHSEKRKRHPYNSCIPQCSPHPCCWSCNGMCYH